MLAAVYKDKIKEVINKFDPTAINKYFIFGSSLRRDKFYDVDIAISGTTKTGAAVDTLKEIFSKSTLPYFVDIVDINNAKDSFKNYVMNKEEKLWLN